MMPHREKYDRISNTDRNGEEMIREHGLKLAKEDSNVEANVTR